MSKFKIYISLGVAVLFLLLVGHNKMLRTKLAKEKSEKELYISNSHVLLDSIKTYLTNDSLNVASIGKIELTLSEYKKYRSEDLKLIESLQVDKKKLQSVTTAQTKTIHELRGSVRDSIVYRDNYIVDSLKCVTIREKWFDMAGCFNRKNEFAGSFENRDSLAIVNHVKQKRFLGFLWYYGKKENRLDVVSKNPNTTIQGVEYIELRD